MNLKKSNIHIICLGLLLFSCLGLTTVAEAQSSKSSSGTILFTSPQSGNWELWSVLPDTNELKQVTKSDEEIHTPAVSPDGKTVLFVNGKRDVRTMNIDGSSRKTVPLPKGIYAYPVWAPDGNSIACVKYKVLPRDQGELWTVGRVNSEWQLPEQISSHPPMKLFPFYSPDGTKIAYSELSRHKVMGVVEELGVYNIAQKSFTLLTTDKIESFFPRWSPNGDQIAYVSNKDGNYDVYLYTLADGRTQQLTRHKGYDGDPAWSPTGDAIVFVSTRSGSRELWVMSAEGERLNQLTDLKSVSQSPVWIR